MSNQMLNQPARWIPVVAISCGGAGAKAAADMVGIVLFLK